MLSKRLTKLLSHIELSSKGSSRFDTVKSWLAIEFSMDPDKIAVKFFSGSKNFRNRLGECLSTQPSVVLALLESPSQETRLVRAIEDRLHMCPSAVILVAKNSDEGWKLTTGIFAPPLADRKQLSKIKWTTVKPSKAPSSVPSVPVFAKRKVSALIRQRSDWTPKELRDAIIREFAIPRAAIALKRISSDKNTHNRINEALGLGVSVLVLDSKSSRAEARAIVQDQLVPTGPLELSIIFGDDPSSRVPIDIIVP